MNLALNFGGFSSQLPAAKNITKHIERNEVKVQVLKKIHPLDGHRGGGGVACVLDTLLKGAPFPLVGRERGLKEKKEEGRTKKKVALSSLFPPSTFLSSLAKERAAGKKVGGIQDALSVYPPPPRPTALRCAARRSRGRVAPRRRAHFTSALR